MDPATIAFSAALLVSFTGNAVQLALRTMAKPNPNGNGAALKAIQDNIAAMNKSILVIQEDMKAHVQLHLAQSERRRANDPKCT